MSAAGAAAGVTAVAAEPGATAVAPPRSPRGGGGASGAGPGGAKLVTQTENGKPKIDATGKTCNPGTTCLKIIALVGIVISILAGVDGNWIACGVAGGVGLLALIPSVVAYCRSRPSGAEKPSGGGEAAKKTEGEGSGGSGEPAPAAAAGGKKPLVAAADAGGESAADSRVGPADGKDRKQ